MTTHRNEQHFYELNTEARLIKLETTTELISKNLTEINQKIDKLDNRLWQLFMWTIAGFGATMAGFVGLFTIMAHGFKWL
ncbi:MAG TPA: hypothetical protein VNX68_01450 [Nitrosopumilaceae archaeon]|jgi:hypothetical protein|nr:hypothetical protein [Nitrosopumilaceae archaeon]